MAVSSRVIALAVVGLLVAAGAAFALGKSSASDDESSASTPAGAPAIEAPAAVSDTPTLQTVGAVPNLKEPPKTSPGGATASPDTGSSPSTGTSTPSSPSTGTGVPSTPPSSQPTPQEPEPPPPPPPPGEG